MSRPLRLEYAGALYHLTSRGGRQEDIYEEDTDRKEFLAILGDVCEQNNWVCHAYCLMSNYYHLVIETLEGNLSCGMRQLNGLYTRRFNKNHSRVGHVFQGRYKAIHVDKESYLLELSRYVVLNPVRAQMVHEAVEWPWSNYRATIGLVEPPIWLNSEWILSCFGMKKRKAVESYKQFVVQGKGQPSIWSNLRNQVYLGGEHFVDQLQELIDENKDLSEIPVAQRRPKPLSIKEYVKNTKTRNEAIIKSYASGGYSQREIGEYFCLHYSRISKILSRAKGKT